MFTDRFIRVPIEMFNKKEAEITGDADASTFEAFMKLNPLEILSYRTAFDNEGNAENKTIVDFKNDSEVVVLMPIHEFENLLNHY